MPDINSKLIKYKNLNLVQTINELFPSYSKSVLLVERDKINSIKRNLETEIFKVFLQNSDSLLDILYAYETVFIELSLLKDLRFITINRQIELVDKKKLVEFKGVIKKFTTSDVLDTGERVLEYFYNLNKYLFLFTNDVLIICKNKSIVNVFDYALIEMIITDKLIIKMNKNNFQYEGDLEIIKRITNTFTNISGKKIIKKYNDLDEYYLYTEQYDKVQTEDALFYDLKTLKKSLKKSLNIVTFLKKKFTLNVNKIKTLPELIEDTFNYLYDFHSEEKDIIKYDISLLLLLEDHILECFKYFEKRIFNKRFYTLTLNEILELIKSKLKWDVYDFSYMVEYFTEGIRHKEEEFVNRAKEEIRDIIHNYLSK